MNITVHSCCGCSCHVCERGHNTGAPHHTDACSDRIAALAEEADRRLQAPAS